MTDDSTPRCGILYIDDEEKALKYFRMAFSDKFPIFTASSGADGLDLLRREHARIGIVVSDQRMPEMLGAQLLGRVREEFPHVVRLLTTAYSDLDSAIQAVNQGHIYQYVVKPWEIPDFGMVLQRAADYHRVLSERNELLALKMTTLQRIICSDRLKWLLLASRYWDAESQATLRCVLLALLQALPPSPKGLSGSAAFNSRQFEITGLIRGEYQNAQRCLDAIDQLRKDAPSAESLLQICAGSLGADPKIDGSNFALAFSGEAKDLPRTVFGVLFDRETTEPSLALFRLLYAVAHAGGTLCLTTPVPETNLSFSFTPAASSEDVIEALASQFSKWDIAQL